MNSPFGLGMFVDLDAKASRCIFFGELFFDLLDLFLIDAVVFEAACSALYKEFFISGWWGKPQLDRFGDWQVAGFSSFEDGVTQNLLAAHLWWQGDDGAIGLLVDDVQFAGFIC